MTATGARLFDAELAHRSLEVVLAARLLRGDVELSTGHDDGAADPVEATAEGGEVVKVVPRRPRKGTGRVTRPSTGIRKAKILDVASGLFHRSGYHNVGMDDIGAAAGVTGPAIYSHFPGKASLLAAIMARTADEMLDVDRVISGVEGPADALRRLVSNQVDFALGNRELISLWIRETRSLPPADQRRIRERQRQFVARWVEKVLELHPDMDPAEALSLVHGAFNLIASIAFYEPKLDRVRLRALLEQKATALLLDEPE